MTRATLGLIYYCLFYVAEVWYLLGDETKFRRREYLNIIREVFLKKGKEGMKDEILKLLIICFSFLLYREILLKRKKRIDSRSIYGSRCFGVILLRWNFQRNFRLTLYTL